MDRVKGLVNCDHGVIKVASGGTSAPPSFLSFFPVTCFHLLSFPFCSSLDCLVFSLASVYHGHYVILLMALEGKEVPMTTSNFVPLSLPLNR